MTIDTDPIDLRVQPDLSDAALNELFGAAWDGHSPRSFQPVLARSLTWIAAFAGSRLVGFVNVAWDGGVHGFILDTTVHGEFQRRGIGTGLMREAARVATERGIEWLHVDFEPRLEPFYRGCGYRPTGAGLLRPGGTR
jgi:ribosomal protein S18 acetylase RimI-like enzyme